MASFVCLWCYVSIRKSYRCQIGQIFCSKPSYFISSEIHKACIAPQKRATYYIFIKRKHIQTLIFKWIFKRTYNHIHFQCVLQFAFTWPNHLVKEHTRRFVLGDERNADTVQPRKKWTEDTHTHTHGHRNLLSKRPNGGTNEWTTDRMKQQMDEPNDMLLVVAVIDVKGIRDDDDGTPTEGWGQNVEM